MAKKTAVENLPELVDNDNKFNIFLAITAMPDGDSFNVSKIQMLFVGSTLDCKVVNSAVSKIQDRLNTLDDVTEVIMVETAKKKTMRITNG